MSEIAEGVASQAALHNTALRQFEARNVRALSRTTTTPAASPADGDSYIIPAGATGVWTGLTNQIASWIGGAWSYYAPVTGVILWINDTSNAYAYNGSAWVLTGGSGAGTVTSVSVTTANGVSGTVATATSTPAISLTLGAITPTSVVASGSVTGSNLSGANTGDQTITLTGDVTGSGSGSFAATVAANAVTNAKAAQMAAHTFKGNNTGATANALDLTSTQLTAELNAVVGDSGSGGTKGLVPAPASGDAAAGKFLKADGTFAVPPGTGGGTVNSVAQTVPAFLSVAGSPITGSGTLAITLSGTALPVANGGTGDTSLTAYAPLFGGTTSTGAVQSGTVGTTGQVLTSNGAGALPTFQSQPFDLMAFWPGVTTASVLVTRVPVARVIVFPASLTGSYVKARVAATAQTDFDLQKNGTSVGTIRFAAAGTVATFVGVSAITTAAGDLISIVGPGTPDTTLADIGFAISGTR